MARLILVLFVALVSLSLVSALFGIHKDGKSSSSSSSDEDHNKQPVHKPKPKLDNKYGAKPEGPKYGQPVKKPEYGQPPKKPEYGQPPKKPEYGQPPKKPEYPQKVDSKKEQEGEHKHWWQ